MVGCVGQGTLCHALGCISTALREQIAQLACCLGSNGIAFVLATDQSCPYSCWQPGQAPTDVLHGFGFVAVDLQIAMLSGRGPPTHPSNGC